MVLQHYKPDQQSAGAFALIIYTTFSHTYFGVAPPICIHVFYAIILYQGPSSMFPPFVGWRKKINRQSPLNSRLFSQFTICIYALRQAHIPICTKQVSLFISALAPSPEHFIFVKRHEVRPEKASVARLVLHCTLLYYERNTNPLYMIYLMPQRLCYHGRGYATRLT